MSKETDELKRQYDNAKSVANSAKLKAHEAMQRWHLSIIKDAGLEIGQAITTKRGKELQIIGLDYRFSSPMLECVMKKSNGEFGKQKTTVFLYEINTDK